MAKEWHKWTCVISFPSSAINHPRHHLFYQLLSSYPSTQITLSQPGSDRHCQAPRQAGHLAATEASGLSPAVRRGATPALSHPTVGEVEKSHQHFKTQDFKRGQRCCSQPQRPGQVSGGSRVSACSHPARGRSSLKAQACL